MGIEIKNRCRNCICLVECDNKWYCDEAEDFCIMVETCPEGLDDEDEI